MRTWRTLRRLWRTTLRALTGAVEPAEVAEGATLPLRFMGSRCLECGDILRRASYRRERGAYVITCPRGHASELLDLGSAEASMHRRPALDAPPRVRVADLRAVGEGA